MIERLILIKISSIFLLKIFINGGIRDWGYGTKIHDRCYNTRGYNYLGHLKIYEIRLNFRTSDNQFLIKFWLLTFSTMEILNPKVRTVPKEIR